MTRYILFFLFLLPHYVKAQHTNENKNAVEQLAKDSLNVSQLIALSRDSHNQRHSEEEEYKYANEAINKSLLLNDTLLYARSLDNLGLLYRFHQKYNEAIPLHIKAFNLVEHKNVKPVYKMIFANNAGVAARYHQEYDLAISYYMKALRIAEKENDLQNIAIATNGIGNALGNISGREEEALNYFKQSLGAEEQRDNSLGIAMNYLSISDYFINKKQFNKALEYLDKLLRINNEREDVYGIAITYEFYGRCYLEEGKDLAMAADYFKKALQRFTGLKNINKQADILYSLGNVHLKSNEISLAKQNFLHSLELAQKINQPGLRMNNYYKLATIYEIKKKPLLALDYLKKGKLYEDSLKLSDQKVKIEAIIRKYNLEKKESHIQLLQKDKDLQQTMLENQNQKLENRRFIIVLLAAGLLFILIIIILQYRNAQTKKRTGALIQTQEKEKLKAIYERNLAQAEIMATRLQMNPHFLFNSLNAIKYLIQTEENQKAMKYLVVFSRYTRMVLETSLKNVVPLTEELMLTRYYLTLEENRFNNDFAYEINVNNEQDLDKINIPPMLLQPFIENAIWHGLLSSKREKKMLTLSVDAKEGAIHIIIDDNGVGRKKTMSKTKDQLNKSMGMQITQDRIELYNKSHLRNITCQIIDKKDEEGKPDGTRVILRISLVS